MGKETQRTEAVIERNDNYVIERETRAIVCYNVTATSIESAAVDPEIDR